VLAPLTRARNTSHVSVGWERVGPEPELWPAQVQAPRRRRVFTARRIGVAALIAAVAFLVWSAVWLLRYDPLAWQGGTSGSPQGTLAWSQVRAWPNETVYYVATGKAGTFEVGFDVTNTGRLAVTLDGLDSESSYAGLRMGRYSVNDMPAGHLVGSTVPFEPVTIEPGDSRFILLRFTVTPETACNFPGSFGGLESPRLRYQTLGLISRTARVEPPFRIATVCGTEIPPDYDGI
jgi:hypothetical protein